MFGVVVEGLSSRDVSAFFLCFRNPQNMKNLLSIFICCLLVSKHSKKLAGDFLWSEESSPLWRILASHVTVEDFYLWGYCTIYLLNIAFMTRSALICSDMPYLFFTILKANSYIRRACSILFFFSHTNFWAAIPRFLFSCNAFLMATAIPDGLSSSITYT